MVSRGRQPERAAAALCRVAATTPGAHTSPMSRSARASACRTGCGAVTVAALALCLFPACAAEAEAPVASATIVSSSGKLRASVRVTPNDPPTRGISQVWLELEDATTGVPIDVEVSSVTPVMPSMGHGTATVATASKGSKVGELQLAPIDFTMAGRWDVKVELKAPPDTLTVSFDVR